ncbi:hypothetical protein AB4156_26560 [Cupriavidus sp. 2MCAB6]
MNVQKISEPPAGAGPVAAKDFAWLWIVKKTTEDETFNSSQE